MEIIVELCMRKFSASRGLKKYSGHTKAMRKINKVKRGGMKKKHVDLLRGKSGGGCLVFIVPALVTVAITSF